MTPAILESEPGTHVYIVDDDESFGRSLRRMLGSRNLLANDFPSAETFLASGSCNDPDGIAVVDVHMPRCDGFLLIDRMRATGCNLPVILITGTPTPGLEELARSKGAVALLQKPFTADELLELLREARHPAVQDSDRATP